MLPGPTLQARSGAAYQAPSHEMHPTRCTENQGEYVMKIHRGANGWRPTRRQVLMTAPGLLALGSVGARAQGAETVRIALPTKTYYPTIIAETALRQKFFEKEGLKAENTVYRGGAEAFEAVAAGAADFTLGSSAIIAAGRKKGVATKGVGGAALGYYGWHLMVKADSKITKAGELEGKKVGITSAGSGSDLLAQWAMQANKINFTRVPLGGGGLVPNMLSGNVDAVVLYSPLTYKVMQDKTARSLTDFGADIPEHLTGIWLATDKLINDKPQVVARTMNALFGAMTFLKANRAEAAKLIAEINEIPLPIAEAEFDGNIGKLSTTGEMKMEWVSRGLDLAKLIGMTDLAEAKDTYVADFKITPTKL
jgi:NitT/TauT family transport system substrate-binding protein